MFVSVHTPIILKFLLLLGVKEILGQEVPTYDCTMDQFGQCIFNGIKLLEPRSRFNPYSDNSTFVTMIGFRNSHIQIFDRDICDEFTNTEVMRLHDLGIRSVTPEAFINCEELRQLTFYSGNFINTLDSKTFASNTKLVALDLEGNRIESLPDLIFEPLISLQDLHLQNNRLKQLPQGVFRYLPNLKYLYFQNNNLLDFDISFIMRLNKNLLEISYFGNPLACSRVEEITESFTDVGISVYSKFTELPAFYEPIIYKNVACLSESSWVAASNRRK